MGPFSENSVYLGPRASVEPVGLIVTPWGYTVCAGMSARLMQHRLAWIPTALLFACSRTNRAQLKWVC